MLHNQEFQGHSPQQWVLEEMGLLANFCRQMRYWYMRPLNCTSRFIWWLLNWKNNFRLISEKNGDAFLNDDFCSCPVRFSIFKWIYFCDSPLLIHNAYLLFTFLMFIYI